MLSFTATSPSKGFTLVEVLVALVLVGLIVSTVFFAYRQSGQMAAWGTGEAEKLTELAKTLWLIQCQMEGIYKGFELSQDSDEVRMGFLTSHGQSLPGIVQARYRFDGKKLFYCELPCSTGDLLYCPPEKEYVLLASHDFKVEAFGGGRWHLNFSQVPKKVRVKIGGFETVALVGTAMGLK